jgi:hypothetical protein
MFSGYIKVLFYPPEVSRNAIELIAHCLAMDPEKYMTIDEAPFRWIYLSLSSWSIKDKNKNPITPTYKIERALDWNPQEKRFLMDLGPAGAVPGAAAESAAISPTNVIENESEKILKNNICRNKVKI